MHLGVYHAGLGRSLRTKIPGLHAYIMGTHIPWVWEECLHRRACYKIINAPKCENAKMRSFLWRIQWFQCPANSCGYSMYIIVYLREIWRQYYLSFPWFESIKAQIICICYLSEPKHCCKRGSSAWEAYSWYIQYVLTWQNICLKYQNPPWHVWKDMQAWCSLMHSWGPSILTNIIYAKKHVLRVEIGVFDNAENGGIISFAPRFNGVEI